MYLNFSFTGLLFSFTLFCTAQASFLDVNVECQAYPTGVIPGLRLESGQGKHTIHLRTGYNWIRHGDFGKHADERGYGFGFSLGYKRYFKTGQTGLFAGAKSDVWFNEIDWTDHIGTPTERTGQTKITVLQPTVEFGYAFLLNPSVVISPNFAFGYEVNVKTQGEQTGEGAIFLLGICVGKRFGFSD